MKPQNLVFTSIKAAINIINHNLHSSLPNSNTLAYKVCPNYKDRLRRLNQAFYHGVQGFRPAKC